MADWTTPKTWEDSELVTADLLNTHLRDNLEALKAPPTATYELDEADITTASTSFTDVAESLELTITTTGGDVWVWFFGMVENSVSQEVFFDIDVDGSRIAGDDGLWRTRATDSLQSVVIGRLISGLAAGEHTFKLQWKVDGGTVTLYAGAGTTNYDLHPQFGVREV